MYALICKMTFLEQWILSCYCIDSGRFFVRMSAGICIRRQCYVRLCPPACSRCSGRVLHQLQPQHAQLHEEINVTVCPDSPQHESALHAPGHVGLPSWPSVHSLLLILLNSNNEHHCFKSCVTRWLLTVFMHKYCQKCFYFPCDHTTDYCLSVVLFCVVLRASWVVTCRVQVSRLHVSSQACFHTLQHGGTRDPARAAPSLSSPPLRPMIRSVCRERAAPSPRRQRRLTREPHVTEVGQTERRVRGFI